MWSKIDVEVCINSASPEYVSRAVTAAQKGGAKRIELCAEMDLDGLTPAKDHIEVARYSFDPAGLLVMIRPRGGHFYYSLEEADVMVRQMRMAAAAGQLQRELMALFWVVCGQEIRRLMKAFCNDSWALPETKV